MKNVKPEPGSHTTERRPTMMKATILYMKTKEAKKVYSLKNVIKRQRGTTLDTSIFRYDCIGARVADEFVYVRARIASICVWN